eukprot:TRINITY_DN363_c0_g2_i1.p1 TRINITY_DN363_c0_g2~~TRINITY_DN363_c0_g2_i1.p1  ORF type:complete len:308 (+),score=60.17 TRINITY_DN363_c0_g2_i1:229-1152(+)
MAGLTTLRLIPSASLDLGLSVSARQLGAKSSEAAYIPRLQTLPTSGRRFLPNSHANRASVVCCEKDAQSIDKKGEKSIVASAVEKLSDMAALRVVTAGVVLMLATGPTPPSLAEPLGTLSEPPPSSVSETWRGLSDVEDVLWWPVEVMNGRPSVLDEARARDEENQGGGLQTLLYRGAGAERGAQTAFLLPSVADESEGDDDEDFNIDEVGAAGVGFCPAWHISSLELIVPDGIHQKPLPPGAQWPASFTPRSADSSPEVTLLFRELHPPSPEASIFHPQIRRLFSGSHSPLPGAAPSLPRGQQQQQ